MLQAGYATYINIQHCLHHRLTYLQKPVLVDRSWCGLAVTVTQVRDNLEQINSVLGKVLVANCETT